MKDTKKSILTIALAALAAFVVGTIAYSAGLGALIPADGTLSIFLGQSAASFGMKCSLIAVIVVVIAVPGIREQFSGSYSAGSNYKNTNKKGRGGRI